jgi:hypothetical protein
MSADPKKPVIDEVVIAINNALGVSERDERASKQLAHFLKWYASDAARAPLPVAVTLTGTLAFDELDNMSLTLPGGVQIDLGEVTQNTEGVTIKGLG